MTRYLLCLLLLCASSTVVARDVRLHGANGDGGTCPDAADAPVTTRTPARQAPIAANRSKAKAPTSFRGGSDDGSPRMPRWHSFLPGMFR